MKNIIAFILLALAFQTQAQTVSDALRYSTLEASGTARTVGVGGAIGAFGADYSVLSTNPAGLAAFRTSEFVVTPMIYNSSTTSLLERGSGNTSNKESVGKFGLANIGMILNNRPRRSKWTTFNFGIGYNRLASFDQEFVVKGRSQGSLVDRFAELANDGLFDEFEVALAENSVAIYTDQSDPNLYLNDFDFADLDYEIDREQFVQTSGSYSEMVLSMAGNYDEKIMVGATVGIPFINYEEQKVYEEVELEGADAVPFFNSLNFREDISTSGVGINLKLGMIYRINQMFRLGAAVHTPTAFSLTDNFSTRLVYDFTDGSGNSNTPQESPNGNFDYKLRTPWRAIGSLGVLFNRKGFLSADIEYVDYSASSFNLTANSTSIDDKDFEIDLNNQISRGFQSAVNLRLGGEYALNKLRFRGGYVLSGTPFADTNEFNNALSLGLGVRERNFYVDFAYRRAWFEEGYIPYLLSDPDQEQFVTNDVVNSHFLITAGFKF